MSTLPKKSFTAEEYLELERKTEYKSEYHDGQIFAMSGVSRRHDRITVNLTLLTGQHLKNRKCQLFTSNMRVLVEASGLYTYPDLSVTCEKPHFTDEHVDTLTNPTLLIEVLSPSTKSYDRGTKAKLYRAIPSLQELLIVSQTGYEIELYRRQQDGTWVLIEAKGLDASLELRSIGYELRLRDVYENVADETAAESAGR